MKKYLILLIVPFIISSASIKKDIVGVWGGTDNAKEYGEVAFNKDGYVLLDMGGILLGGKEFDFQGLKAKSEYVYNTKVTPIQLDLIITVLETKQSMSMLGIVEFINKDKIRYAMDITRPTDFLNENNVVVLDRINK